MTGDNHKRGSMVVSGSGEAMANDSHGRESVAAIEPRNRNREATGRNKGVNVTKGSGLFDG